MTAATSVSTETTRQALIPAPTSLGPTTDVTTNGVRIQISYGDYELGSELARYGRRSTSSRSMHQATLCSTK